MSKPNIVQTTSNTKQNVQSAKKRDKMTETYHQHTEVWCMTSHTKHSCFKIFFMASQVNKSHNLQHDITRHQVK